MRYLGIDYGEKRIGLSYADELRIASPLKAAVQPSLELRLQYIKGVIQSYGVQALVVGYPYHLDGSSGKAVERVEAFVQILKDQFQLPIFSVDEACTTQDAGKLAPRLKSLRQQKAYRNSGELDSRAAALLLQDFLDQEGHSLAPDTPPA